MGEVDHGGFVSGGRVVDDELVLVGQGVNDGDRERARIAFLAVLAQVLQLHPDIGR